MTPHRPPFPFPTPHANGRREDVFASHQQPDDPPLIPIPADPWDGFVAPVRAVLAWLTWGVWLAYFAAVLLPVGLVGYGIGAAMRTARETWRNGWDDHATAGKE